MANYATSADMTTRLSQAGLMLRSDHDAASLNQSINWASRQIDFYLLNRYPTTNFLTNAWVNYATTVFACYHLCWTRLNSIPAVLKGEKEQLEKQLQTILEGQNQLPGAANSSGAPVLTTQRVALGSYPPLLVETAQCVGPGVPPARRDDPFQPSNVPRI